MEEPMSDDSGGAGSTGVVAILVIFVIIVVAALFLFGGRMLNGNKKVDINIQTPSKWGFERLSEVHGGCSKLVTGAQGGPLPVFYVIVLYVSYPKRLSALNFCYGVGHNEERHYRINLNIPAIFISSFP